jgi:type IV fimbrial biogenesis protein FimT
MTSSRRPRRPAGVTLIELMIAVALVAIIVALAAPSFRSMIQVQRLRGVQSQLVTDVQFARSEATRLRTPVRVRVQEAGACYILYSDRTPFPFANPCDCQQPPGLRCPDPRTSELKTVLIDANTGVSFENDENSGDVFGWDPYTDAIQIFRTQLGRIIGSEFTAYSVLDANRRLRLHVGFGGRVISCTPDGSTVSSTPC